MPTALLVGSLVLLTFAGPVADAILHATLPVPIICLPENVATACFDRLAVGIPGNWIACVYLSGQIAWNSACGPLPEILTPLLP
ncbi:MAG: hypothetical protein QOE90_2840 [Thermoplasmata archaeon]|jgi:hypothetical protein|nr:hypothetical protein [Thermoplasmata archaeon]